MIDQHDGSTRSVPFPQQGSSYGDVMATLRERLAEIPGWAPDETALRFGYAMTEPAPVALEALRLFQRQNSNNIGVHTRFGDGATGTRRLEKEALAMLAHLYGGNALDGYLTSGATEGIIEALRIARNVLRTAGSKRPLVLTGALAHHSVDKAAEIVDLPTYRLPLRQHWVIDLDDLRDEIERRLADGVDGIVLVSTVGYFGCGMVDDIPALSSLLFEVSRTTGTPVYHHIDASHGGLLIPFTAPDLSFGFDSRLVHSIVVDGHKNGLVPYPCGIFLARSGLLEHARVVSPLTGMVDETITSSRSGAMAAALWAVIHEQGYEGLAEIARECLERRDRLTALLTERIPDLSVVSHPAMNSVAFAARGRRPGDDVKAAYRLETIKLPDPYQDGVVELFSHAYLMPHMTDEQCETFVDQLAASLQPVDRERTATLDRDPTVLALKSTTPCLRYAVAHPPGRRDPGEHPHNYSFHEFTARSATREPIVVRDLPGRYVDGQQLSAWCPDHDRPFGNELYGVGVPGVFWVEVLDRYQQELSLVGATHFQLRCGGGARLLANFDGDGEFRSVELKWGSTAVTDDVQLFRDQALVKLGKHATGIRRSALDYSFSIDTSLELRLTWGSEAAATADLNVDPLLPRSPHLPRKLLRRFPNRLFGTLVELTVPHQGAASAADLLAADPAWPLLARTATRGTASVDFTSEDGNVEVTIAGDHGAPGAGPSGAGSGPGSPGHAAIRLPAGLGERLAAGAPRLDVRQPESLDVADVADFAEQVYRYLTPLAAAMDDTAPLALNLTDLSMGVRA